VSTQFSFATVAEHRPPSLPLTAQRSTIDAALRPFAMTVTMKIYFSLPSGKQEVSR